jgi:hypothetical protein
VISTPLPGDFCCCNVAGDIGGFIHLGQKLSGGPYSQYEHVFVYIGDGLAVQAEPGGAKEVKCPNPARQLWSTGSIKPTDDERRRIVTSARMYAQSKVPYSFLDYAAIFAHQEHLNLPGVRQYISHTGHMICSQLVDQCYFNAGHHLFIDGRWPGYVRPSDMAWVIMLMAGEK